MLWKRAIHARRDRLGIVTMYVVPILFVVLGIAVSKISNEAFEDPPPAVMDRSYLGDLPTAFSAATTLDVQRVTGHLSPSEVLPVPRTGGTWRCWNPSPVVDVCRPDAFDPIIPGCPNCTAPEDLQNTIDGFLLSNIPDQATCANPEHTDNASCAALLVDSAAGFAVPGRTREVNYTVMVSSTAYHALPASIASFHDAVFKALHHDAPDATLVSINHPMPTTSEQKLEQAMLMHLVVSLCALLGLACLSASASAFLVWERTSASKHLQMVSGLHRGVFWAGAYVWDLIAFGPPLAIFLVIFAASEEEAYTGESFAVVAAALAAVRALRPAPRVPAPLAFREQHGVPRRPDGSLLLLRCRADNLRRRAGRVGGSRRGRGGDGVGGFAVGVSVAAALLRRSSPVQPRGQPRGRQARVGGRPRRDRGTRRFQSGSGRDGCVCRGGTRFSTWRSSTRSSPPRGGDEGSGRRDSRHRTAGAAAIGSTTERATRTRTRTRASLRERVAEMTAPPDL